MSTEARLGIKAHGDLMVFTMRGARGGVKARMVVDARYAETFLKPIFERELADALAEGANRRGEGDREKATDPPRRISET